MDLGGLGGQLSYLLDFACSSSLSLHYQSKFSTSKEDDEIVISFWHEWIADLERPNMMEHSKNSLCIQTMKSRLEVLLCIREFLLYLPWCRIFLTHD